MGCMSCTGPQCLYKGALYLYISWHKYFHIQFLGNNGLQTLCITVQVSSQHLDEVAVLLGCDPGVFSSRVFETA